jgi:hypothetical protein
MRTRTTPVGYKKLACLWRVQPNRFENDVQESAEVFIFLQRISLKSCQWMMDNIPDVLRTPTLLWTCMIPLVLRPQHILVYYLCTRVIIE